MFWNTSSTNTSTQCKQTRLYSQPTPLPNTRSTSLLRTQTQTRDCRNVSHPSTKHYYGLSSFKTLREFTKTSRTWLQSQELLRHATTLRPTTWRALSLTPTTTQLELPRHRNKSCEKREFLGSWTVVVYPCRTVPKLNWRRTWSSWDEKSSKQNNKKRSKINNETHN